MINETRNELLTLLTMIQRKNTEREAFHLECLLECFERDIQKKLEDLKLQEQTLKDNMEVLQYVKEQLNIK